MTSSEVAPHAAHLRDLAARIGAVLVDHLDARSVLLAGSAAEGDSDEFSDIDMVVFHAALPPTDRIAAAMATLGATDLRPLGSDPEAGFTVEQWTIDGVACQFVHQTEACWSAQIAPVLRGDDIGSPTQKALWGMQRVLVLHGADVYARVTAGAVYTDDLAGAMVRGNLDIFPLWRPAEGLARRDAEWWQRSELVDGLGKVLALLAGANRVFFSRFQLKHMRAWIAALSDTPPDLASRVEAALVAPFPDAAYLLEALVADTLDIVDARLGDAVDTSGLRGLLHGRHQPWTAAGGLRSSAAPS